MCTCTESHSRYLNIFCTGNNTVSLLTPWTPRFAGALDVNVKVFPSNVGNLAFDSVEHCSLMLLADYTAMSSGGGDVHAACVILFLPGGGL